MKKRTTMNLASQTVGFHDLLLEVGQDAKDVANKQRELTRKVNSLDMTVNSMLPRNNEPHSQRREYHGGVGERSVVGDKPGLPRFSR